MLIKNPKEYDKKVPTNIRLEADLKKKLKIISSKLNISMSDLINLIIREKLENMGI